MMNDVWGVECQDVVYLLEEIEHIGKGKTFSGDCLFIVLSSQLGQFLESFTLCFIKLEFDRLLKLFYGDLADFEGYLLLLCSLFLFCKSNYHNL